MRCEWILPGAPAAAFAYTMCVLSHCRVESQGRIALSTTILNAHQNNNMESHIKILPTPFPLSFALIYHHPRSSAFYLLALFFIFKIHLNINSWAAASREEDKCRQFLNYSCKNQSAEHLNGNCKKKFLISKITKSKYFI
jgi:hypothetical protein